MISTLDSTIMGISDIRTLIGKYKIALPMSTWAGKRIAVDVSTSAHQHFNTALSVVQRHTPTDQDLDMDEVKLVLKDRMKAFYSVFKEENIDVVAVFDGPPPKEKNDTIAKRTEQRRSSKQRYHDAKVNGDLATMLKNLNWMVRMGDEINDMFRETIEELGFATLFAEEEAESVCCRMFHRGDVVAVYSRDIDVLAYRVETMICDDPRWIGDQRYVDVYLLSRVLDGLELTKDQWLDLCIMCGCDYNSRIPLVGPKTAYKHLRRHQSIEGVLAHLPKDGSCLNHQRCREIFRLNEQS